MRDVARQPQGYHPIGQQAQRPAGMASRGRATSFGNQARGLLAVQLVLLAGSRIFIQRPG